MASKEPAPVPEEMVHVAKMKMAGVTISYQDYCEMPGLLRDDLVMWGIAETNARIEAASNG